MNSYSNNEKGELNQVKSRKLFDYLRSDYFLQKLFGHFHTKKSLEITKYNKKLQKRININIDNYIEFARLYSSIEIEIRPYNGSFGSHNQFINYGSRFDNKHFHIYFNDNKKEIKRNYLKNNNKVQKKNIRIDYAIKSFDFLFEFCESIESIYFKKFLEIILVVCAICSMVVHY